MRKAFTLLELLMVIAIIGIISTLAVNKIGSIRESAARRVSIANQKAVEHGIGAFLATGGRLNRLDSLMSAGSSGVPLSGSGTGFDFDAPLAVGDDGVYRGPTADDPTGVYRADYNAGLVPSLTNILCRYVLSSAQVQALNERLGLTYVMSHTCYADAADDEYPSQHYPRTRAYGDGSYPDADSGLYPNDSACVSVAVTNMSMTLLAVNPRSDLGRQVYQSCGQELLNNNRYWGDESGYDRTAVAAEVERSGGPLLVLGLGDRASVIGSSSAGLDAAPYATFVEKRYYSRYLLLIRLRTAGSGSVKVVLPELAGVLDPCGNTIRAAHHILKSLP